MKNTHLKDRIEEYLDYRRSLGYGMAYQDAMLRSFARFVARRRFQGPLKRQWVEEFVSAPQGVNPAYYTSRHRVLYDFARYWAAFDPCVEIPAPRGPQVGYRRSQPYIYSGGEVQSLMEAARRGAASRPLVGETLAAIIGLMACAGLRRGEAVNLRRDDVDLKHSILRVRRSKNRPLRLVPLQASAMAALQDYAYQRDRAFPVPGTDHFFLNKLGGAMLANDFTDNFRRIRQRAGIKSAGGRQPRAHDLRHTFACNCLVSWLREGRDVSRSAHLLATYLGHDGLKETYWYLSGIPALLELVGRRFEQYASADLRGNQA